MNDEIVFKTYLVSVANLAVNSEILDLTKKNHDMMEKLVTVNLEIAKLLKGSNDG